MLVISQAQTVPLTPFVDNGGTKTHAVGPTLLSLTGSNGKWTTTLRVGTRSVRIWVTGTGGKRSLLADPTGNGRSEGGPMSSAVQTLPDGKTVTIYQGLLKLGAMEYGVNLFVSDTMDPGFARVRDRLVLHPLSGFVGRARFGATTYRIGIRGTTLANGALFIDRDGDGVLGTVPAELFDMAKPFSLGGRSYRVATFDPARATVAFASSPIRVAEVPMPPDLRVGHLAPTLTSRTLGGKPVQFPSSFRGKLVMLDVWATWCGPCRAEIPYMRNAYARFHGKGFDIVSFSIDDPGTQARVAAFTKGMGEPWTQAFEGKGWASPVCQRYAIHGIPFLLLVDATSGRIVAGGDSLRGPRMAPAIAAALAKRR